jgi:hypothetical protein
MDVECSASSPIILGRTFLRTLGAIIDMKEGIIKYQFSLKKGMEHFPRRRKNYFLTLFLEQIVNLMLHRLILLDFHLSAPSSKVLKKSTLGR